VGLAPPRMVRTDVGLHADGQAQERRWSAQRRQHVREEQRWSEERHFGTRGRMCGRARRGAAVVVRQHGQ